MRYRAFIVLAALTAQPVLAAQPAAKPALPATGADNLGRLFFTPAQRAQLDVARSQRSRATLASENPEAAAEPAPQIINYGGFVRRSDGKTTVWVNQRPLNDRETVTGVVLKPPAGAEGRLSVQVPDAKRRLELKVGQSAEILSGTIDESFARRPPAPKPEAEVTASPPPGTAKPPPGSPPDAPGSTLRMTIPGTPSPKPPEQ